MRRRKLWMWHKEEELVAWKKPGLKNGAIKKHRKIEGFSFFPAKKNPGGKKKPLNALLGRCSVSGRVQVQPCLPSWTSKGHVSQFLPAVHSAGTSFWHYTTKMCHKGPGSAGRGTVMPLWKSYTFNSEFTFLTSPLLQPCHLWVIWVCLLPISVL